MSLYIYGEGKTLKKFCGCCGNEYESEEELFSKNITHNLAKMAGEADLYDWLWSYDIEGKKAKELIEPVTNGIYVLKQYPEHYKQFSSENGWGTYDHFVPWLEELLQDLKNYPEATIRISK